MTTNIEQDKAEFEVWYIPRYEESCESKTCYGRYMGIAWQGWQSALKLERERQVSGEAVAWNFEYDQLTEEFIYELDDKTAMTISGFNRGSWAQYFNSQKNHPPKDSTKLFTAPQQSPIPQSSLELFAKIRQQGDEITELKIKCSALESEIINLKGVV